MAIPKTVHRCLVAFEKLSAIVGGDDLLDQEGRFKSWAGNVSAHTTGKRSLQYRLRESSYLSDTVTSYLTDLLDILHDLERPSILSKHAQIDEIRSDSDDDDDAMLFGIEANATTNPTSQGIEEINSIITCLMRVSMALRNPAKDDQVRYALEVSVEHFEPHDIEHVRTKFPQVADDVVQTLVAALSRHRRYFKHREDHHEKLSEGINGQRENDTERPSTVATSLGRRHEGKSGPNTCNDTSSMCTATSYATTRTGESHLQLPPRPDAGADGEPFECPICFHLIEAPDEHSWRRHVYEDLPPYVCIVSNCWLRGRQFSRRRDWRRHLKEHNAYWTCPFNCPTTFKDTQAFEKHLKAAHLHGKCEYEVDILLSSSARTEQDSSCLRCPLCSEEKDDVKIYYKHLGHHMEQLALFALPSRIYGDQEEEHEESEGTQSTLAAAPEHSIVSSHEDFVERPISQEGGRDQETDHRLDGPTAVSLEASSPVSSPLERLVYTPTRTRLHDNAEVLGYSSLKRTSEQLTTSEQPMTGETGASASRFLSEFHMSTAFDGVVVQGLQGAVRRSHESPQPTDQDQVHGGKHEASSLNDVGGDLQPRDSGDSAHDGSKRSQEDRPEPEEDELYKCTWPGCSHKSKLMCEIRKHFQSKHQSRESRPHGCPHCAKRFNWPKDVRRHIKQVHKDAITDVLKPQLNP